MSQCGTQETIHCYEKYRHYFFLFATSAQQKPNIIFICADDLEYGDLSCYGATRMYTPNIDQLAKQDIWFTNAHATSSTCTPSRFALMTGQY